MHTCLPYLDQLVLSFCPCSLLAPPQYALVLLCVDINWLLIHNTSRQLHTLLWSIAWQLIAPLIDVMLVGIGTNKSKADTGVAADCSNIPFVAVHTSCWLHSMPHSRRAATKQYNFAHPFNSLHDLAVLLYLRIVKFLT